MVGGGSDRALTAQRKVPFVWQVTHSPGVSAGAGGGDEVRQGICRSMCFSI